MKRVTFCVSILMLVFCTFSLKVFAADSELLSNSVPEKYSVLVDELDGQLGDILPDKLHSSDIGEVGEAVSELASVEYIFSFLLSTVEIGLNKAISLFASLCGLLVLSAVFSALKNSFSSQTLSNTVGICTSVALFGCVIMVQAEHFLMVSEFFERLSLIMNGMIPTISVIYAMGGNISTAATSGVTLYVFLAFCEEFCRTSVLPVAAVCTALAMCSSFSGGIKLSGLSSSVKKCYTFILILVMTVLLAVLSSQTYLTSAADSVSARAAKLVASNVIPIVGSSVGDTLRTLSSSVVYIKNVCGVGGIIFIFLLLLPTLISLLLSRAVFTFTVAIADIVGCDNESRLLSELGSVYGVLIAVVSMCSVMFIFAITIFLRCSVAVG